MADLETSEHAETFSMLCRHTQDLIQRVDGPVRRVRATAGGCSIEVECAPVDAHGARPHDARPDDAQAHDAQAHDARPSDDGLISVVAPLVGTFYAAPEPGAEPFVRLGQTVEEGQQLAVIEAMKLMNPVTAACRARVVAVHAADGQMVEYDQPLMDLEPAADSDRVPIADAGRADV